MSRAVFADLKNDYMFVCLFGSEARKPILIAFLDTILALDGPHRIASVTLKPPPMGRPKVPGLRCPITRAECTDGRGARYAVEMQVLHIAEFHRRCIDESRDAFTEPLAAVEARPENGDELGITISEFELWPEKGPARVPMLSRRRVRERPNLELVCLELPKYGGAREPGSPVDKWAYLFREARSLTSIPPELACSPFVEVLEAARVARFSHVESDAYVAVWMAIEDKRALLEKAYEDGYRVGLVEGFEKSCKEHGIDLSAEERREMRGLDTERLKAMIARIAADRGRTRRWWS